MPQTDAATAADLSARTLESLRATRLALVSFAFHDALRNAPRKDRQDAALRRVAVTRAIRALENAELADIAGRLEANEAALSAAADELDDALGDLARARRVLDASAKAISLVGKALDIAL